MRITLLQIFCFSLLTATLAFGQTTLKREYFLSSPSTQKYVVILGGAAAGKKYADRFREWTLKLHDMLITEYGYQRDRISLLLGHGDPDEPRISGPCRQETIQEMIRALQNTVRPGDQILFFLVGHGTSDEEEAKFNIVGPDITNKAFSSILGALSEQDIVVVNTTSSSYPFCTALSGPGRVIISSTRSRAEKYDTIFPQYFIKALEDHAGDRDKNKRVSMWEAFLFARKSVEKWYTEQNRLLSEHAVLDDNGDGLLSTNPDPAKHDGRLAQIAYLDLLVSEPTLGTLAGVDISLVRELTAKMRDLERSIFLLRNQKAALPKRVYQKELEVLLIELARTNRELKNIKRTPADSPE